ncbi:hypothetical protein Tco_0344980 [Tanacetum coccineum]
MASTRASISKASKKPKINIIPPKQLFVDLTHDDTKTPSPTLQLSSPSAPNAPSKTPSTKDTSSSLIDYIPKSPTSSTSLSPNGYLNSPTSPPLRVSPPPPTQENAINGHHSHPFTNHPTRFCAIGLMNFLLESFGKLSKVEWRAANGKFVLYIVCELNSAKIAKWLEEKPNDSWS